MGPAPITVALAQKGAEPAKEEKKEEKAAEPKADAKEAAAPATAEPSPATLKAHDAAALSPKALRSAYDAAILANPVAPAAGEAKNDDRKWGETGDAKKEEKKDEKKAEAKEEKKEEPKAEEKKEEKKAEAKAGSLVQNLLQMEKRGVPIIVNPVIMKNTEGDVDLGLKMLVGPDEVSVAKKNAAKAKKFATFAEIKSSDEEEESMLLQLNAQNPVNNPPWNNWSVNQPTVPHNHGLSAKADMGQNIIVEGTPIAY